MMERFHTFYLSCLFTDGGCQTPFHQTAYRTANTTISCDKRNSEVMFFCKEKGSICEDILLTKSPPKSNGSFTLTETSSSFNMSISNVSSEHAGVYWCGVETDNGSNRAALRKIQLEVKDTITNSTKSLTVGQNLTYWCKYPEGTTIKKIICKGEDPSICIQIVSTAQSNVGKFSMMDDNVKRNITITVRNVTTEDTGTYWCGAERNDPKQSNPFFHRLMMTVVPAKKPPRPTPPTFPVSSTQSTTTTPAPAGRHGEEIITVTVCVSVVVLLLLFVLILILIYKRKSYYWFAEHQTHAHMQLCLNLMESGEIYPLYGLLLVYFFVLCLFFLPGHSKNKRNAAAAQHKEEYIYEEIQEQPHNPDSGNAMNTMYATANFPTSPSASLHYSTVNFKNRSDKAGAEILLTKPSSSACEYSTVKNSQSQTSSTVNQPSSEDPLYSTVNKSRQQ
ncbi:CMRF35-like molecule 8 [Sander lucioperca]|uniref:CMRF35-like molecule 8 n=1 Tax=Sander lucioperca TaxID=283035 RepID=UPI0016534E08|nr:CMRF35-like molecule 8 [Sander lucioperca]